MLIDPTGMSAESGGDPSDPVKLPTIEIIASRLGQGIEQDNTIAPLKLPIRDNPRSKNPDKYWKVTGDISTSYYTNNEMYAAVHGTGSPLEKMIYNGDFGQEHVHGWNQYGIKKAISNAYDIMSIPVLAVVPIPVLGGIGGVSKYGWKGLSYGGHELTIGYLASTGIGLSYRHSNSIRTMALDYHTLQHHTGHMMPVLHGHYAQKGVWKINKHLIPSVMYNNFSALNKGMVTPGHKKTALYRNLQQAILGN